MNLHDLQHGLIVSCQAHDSHPLRDPFLISAMAVCAEKGGAVGIRADGPEDVHSIRERVSLPIIGIYKVPLGSRFFITPAFEHARSIVEAGADMVALEATIENRPTAKELENLVHSIQKDLGVPVMADVSTLDEGLRAWETGADLVATTLSGHTAESQDRNQPDLELVGELAEAKVRVVCEGNIRVPQQVAEAMRLGAWAVVVGTAITDPVATTSWFVRATRGDKP